MSVFIPAQYAQNVDPPPSSIYVGGTATGSTTTEIIDKFTLNNVTAAVVICKVYLGGTDPSQLTLQVPVPANASYLCGELVGHELTNGEGVFVYADTASAISVRAGGRAR